MNEINDIDIAVAALQSGDAVFGPDARPAVLLGVGVAICLMTGRRVNEQDLLTAQALCPPGVDGGDADVFKKEGA